MAVGRQILATGGAADGFSCPLATVRVQAKGLVACAHRRPLGQPARYPSTPAFRPLRQLKRAMHVSSSDSGGFVTQALSADGQTNRDGGWAQARQRKG